MSFGWSAGDVLAAAKFIIDVTSALDEVDGAPKVFREASSFLKNLNTSLTPLEAFSALDTKPTHKAKIETEVKAIKTPIEKFIDDVKDMQKTLGIPQEGHFRHLRNIPSKLKWHFVTSKKALALEKEVDRHLKTLNTLMSQVTWEIVHTLPADIKSGCGETLEEKLNVHFPAFQAVLLAELSKRDYAMRAAWEAEITRILEKYLRSQRVNLTTTPSVGEPTSAASNAVTPDALKANAAHLESTYQARLVEGCDLPMPGITSDSEVTSRLRSWWASAGSEILWVQTPPRDIAEESLASYIVALSRAAKFPVVAYFCQRVNAEGYPLSQFDVFIDLVYSLIYQLCSCITDDISCPIDMSGSRFSALDGTIRSIPDAFSLFRDLLSLKPGRQLLLIDGIEMLDYSNDSCFEGYLKALFETARDGDNNRMIKTLITTEGHSGMVLDEIGWENTVDASLSSSADGFYPISEFEAALEEDHT